MKKKSEKGNLKKFRRPSEAKFELFKIKKKYFFLFTFSETNLPLNKLRKKIC